jgi:hypothetical protein
MPPIVITILLFSIKDSKPLNIPFVSSQSQDKKDSLEKRQSFGCTI